LKQAVGYENCIVVDIFAIPDYTAMFEDCVDTKFGGYSKLAKTQLQFIFEAVPVSEEYKFGSKVTYRAYSSENVIEIVEGINVSLPEMRICPRQCFVHTYPKNDDGTPSGITFLFCINLIYFAFLGMTIINKLPVISDPFSFPMQSFVPDSRQIFDETKKKVMKYFGKLNSDNGQNVIEKWLAWDRDVIPQTDSVDDYVIS
jgi:hypothetical protein